MIGHVELAEELQASLRELSSAPSVGVLENGGRVAVLATHGKCVALDKTPAASVVGSTQLDAASAGDNRSDGPSPGIGGRTFRPQQAGQAGISAHGVRKVFTRLVP